MNIHRFHFVLMLTVLSFPALGIANDCRSIDNDKERLACYDERDAKSAASAPERVVDIDDTIGRETVDEAKSEQPAIVRGHVSRCRKTERHRYLFYFDNGQIWQQKDNVRLGWENCDFDVSIVRDFFGYKMQPDGEKRRVRISRVR